MKRRLLFIALLFCFGMNAQELTFKERYKIFFKEQVKVIDYKAKTTKQKDTVFDKNGTILSYKLDTIYDWKSSKDIKDIERKFSNTFTFADIKLEKDKIFIYPWTYSDTVANKEITQFFEKNQLYIKLEDRINQKLRFRSYNIGVITIPFKIYLGNHADVRGNNVETDVNLMLYGGWRWGHSHFLKLPNKDDVLTYNHSYSFNFLLGLSKLTLDKDNSYGDGTLFEGNVAALNTGASLAYHYRKFSILGALGFDFPFDHSSQWSFHDKPWLGFGFGFELFTLNESN